MSKTPANKDSEKYQDMLRDVEGIVTKMSNQQLDLDDMVREIELGYGLIKKMRERLDHTKMTVEKLRVEFEEKTESQ